MTNQGKEVWLCHHSLSNGESGVFLCYASNREDYSRQILSYCQSRGYSEEHQLAPLPLLTWIKRHGMVWNYWYYAETLSLNNPFIFISQSTLDKSQLPVTNTSYLIEKKQDISELGRQFGERFPLIVPKELSKVTDNGFFAYMDWYADYLDEEEAPKLEGLSQSTTIPNYYLVIDAEKSFFFPSDFIKDFTCECLYKGKSYETAGDVAPYLLQLKSGDRKSRDFVQRLFTQHEDIMQGYWDINPAIFIRSHQDFDTVFTHLRKFTHLFGKNSYGEEKWYFFRFYDPAVLVAYLQGIEKYPNHLKSFLGIRADGSRIIESFGARVDEQFYHFVPEVLPDDTVSVKIEYGELEKEIFIQFNWERLKKQLLNKLAIYDFPFSDNELNQWLEEAKSKQMVTSPRAYWAYLAGRAVATAND